MKVKGKKKNKNEGVNTDHIMFNSLVDIIKREKKVKLILIEVFHLGGREAPAIRDRVEKGDGRRSFLINIHQSIPCLLISISYKN